MCARMGVSTETCNLREVKGELVLEPVDSVAGAASQDANEVIASEFTSLQAKQKRLGCGRVRGE